VHAPFCHLWPAWLYSAVFFPYLINGRFLDKSLLNIKCVIWFSLHLLSEKVLILRRNEQDIINNVRVHLSKSWKPLLCKIKEGRQPPKTQQFDFYYPLPTPTHPISFAHPPVGLSVSRDPSQLVSVLWPAPTQSPSILMAQAISETNLFPYNTPNMSSAQFILHTPTCLWRWNRQSVPKRRHLKFRRRGITQKKAYNNLY